MAIFTVHQPPLGKGENAPDPTRFAFVRDGFYVWGFLLSVLWMLRHRLWLVAVLFVALTVLIEVGLALCRHRHRDGARWCWLPCVIWSVSKARRCGAGRCRCAATRRSASVIADNRDEAEQRFFINWTATRKAKPASARRRRGAGRACHPPQNRRPPT